MITTLLTIISTYAAAATFVTGAQTYPLVAAYEPARGPVVVEACGTVWACAPGGATYSQAAVLWVPDCSVDRISFGGFE